MTEALIREAGPEDLPACAAILNAYIDATDWLPRSHPHEVIAAMFSPRLLQTRRVFVAEQDGAVVGYVTLNPQARFLPALYLSPADRGRGLGKTLLDAVKAVSPAGFSLTVWQPNRDARRFYLREGLSVIGEGTDDDGLPVWNMTWSGQE
ncbi:GNAT family N-acetyltransferase [Paracoccus marinaquae]|uniref:GNAT family N-acetyltransferase n=1 Tax=Paracoccus marinaquae TaxID=2841926 RepID=A0ABS6AK89_9RHOB|nr:GNAT family N-acetyltransferase [Paracoccus marinaquae]MBU3029811.1 GNAT family N-acetyltransferase [Paracoccus marinaquae]